jgi:hypothetical protein
MSRPDRRNALGMRRWSAPKEVAGSYVQRLIGTIKGSPGQARTGRWDVAEHRPVLRGQIERADL